MEYAVVVMSQNSLPSPRSQRFSSVFFSNSFIVSYLESMIHFQLIFVQGVQLRSMFLFLFSYQYPIASTPFVENNNNKKTAILSELNYFCTFVKSLLGLFGWVYF